MSSFVVVFVVASLLVLVAGESVRQHVLRTGGTVDSIDVPLTVANGIAEPFALASIAEQLQHTDRITAVPHLMRVVLVGNMSVSSGSTEFELRRGSPRLLASLLAMAPNDARAVDRVLAQDWASEQHRVPTVYVIQSLNRVPYPDASSVHGCAYAHGVALDNESRFAWLDMSVRGVSFGPMTFGDGGEYNMSESLDHQVALANFFYQTYEQLVAPRPVREPLLHSHEPSTVTLVHIRDHARAYDVAALERALNSVALLPGQRISVLLGAAYDLHECVECQVAIDLATMTAPDRPDHYLDARALVDALDRFGLSGRDASEAVLYLLDFERTPLRLLDAKLFAVPLQSRVVAVQAVAAPLHTDYFCNAEVALAVPTNDASSAIFAALLTTLFGVGPAPTHLFDMFRSPFGPLAAASQAPLAPPHFGIRDAPARFQILDGLNLTHRSLADALLRFQIYQHDLSAGLTQDEAHQVARRWALFCHKREQLLHSLAVYDTADAYAFLRALQFDARAITKLLFDVAGRLGNQLLCNNTLGRPATTNAPSNTESFWFFVNALSLTAIISGIAIGFLSSRRSTQTKTKKW
jgi:hypothetical protein